MAPDERLLDGIGCSVPLAQPSSELLANKDDLQDVLDGLCIGFMASYAINHRIDIRM